MSLRTEIRDAIDEVARPAPWLADQAVATVFKPPAREKRSREWSLGIRVPMALVAALLVLAVMAGILIGGRLLHDLHTGIPSDHMSQKEFVAHVTQLEARAVILPTLMDDVCNDSGVTYSSGTQYGSDPVSAYRGMTTTTAWGEYIDFDFYFVVSDNPISGVGSLKTPLTGPILVRGRDLRTGATVVFAGAGGTGAVGGTDPTQSPPDLRSELVIDTSRPARVVGGPAQLGHIATYGVTSGRLGLPLTSGKCFGLQIDTLGSPPTEILIVAG